MYTHLMVSRLLIHSLETSRERHRRRTSTERKDKKSRDRTRKVDETRGF